MGATSREVFLQSLERCESNKDFIPNFYVDFLSRSNEIREKFKSTDFDKQYEMLSRSLALTAGSTSGDPESLREINERAITHDRDHLDIDPSLYEYWFTSVITVASKTDPEWNETVEEAWFSILGFVVRHMVSKY